MTDPDVPIPGTPGAAPRPERTPACDLLLSAAHLLTMAAAPSRGEPDAVAVLDGRIVDVGTRAELGARWAPATAVHLDGHVLLPGLVNAHTHLGMTMLRGVADDRDLDDFLATVVPVESEVLSDERVHRATRAAALESVLAGVTTALDMYFFADAGLRAAEEAGLRLLTGPVLFEGGPGSLPWDEVLSEAASWLAAHPRRPGWRPVLGPHSTYTLEPHHLAEVARLAEGTDGGRVLVHVHASETAAENELVAARHGRRPVGLLHDVGLLGPSTVLAHAVHLDDDELALLGATGAAVAHCPASNLKLASGVARVPELVAGGVPVGIGTDGPASSNDLDVLGATRLASLLHKGIGSGGRGPGEPTALPAATTLRLATLDGARALGLDEDLGSLEVGKVADLVAIDLDRPHLQPVRDVASAVVYAAGRGDVTDVWVAGERVVAAGRSTRVDERAVSADLRDLGRWVDGRRRDGGPAGRPAPS